MKIVKELLKKLEIAEVKANEAEFEYEKDYMNEAKEKAFDEAYKIQFNLYIATAKELVKVTNNCIDFNTAKTLVMAKRDDLKALLANN